MKKNFTAFIPVEELGIIFVPILRNLTDGNSAERKAAFRNLARFLSGSKTIIPHEPNSRVEIHHIAIGSGVNGKSILMIHYSRESLREEIEEPGQEETIPGFTHLEPRQGG